LARRLGLLGAPFGVCAAAILLHAASLGHSMPQLLLAADRLRHVALTLYPSNVADRVPAATQRVRIVPARTLAAGHDAELLARVRLPYTQVTVVRATEHEA